jgi:ribokinase
MSVFCCGSLHLDVMMQAPNLPRLDETVVGTGVAYAFGGKGGNQAVAAAKMGAQVAMAGRIGDDAFGQTLLNSLMAAGVDIGQIQRGQGASGMSTAIVCDGGGYGAVIVSAANLDIDPTVITIPKHTRVVLLQNEIPEAVNISVAQQARDLGVMVILNAAPARKMSPLLLDLVDILVVNRVEAADMMGLAVADLDPMRPLMAARAIITLGGDGLVIQDGASRHQSAHRVQVISTHGAGDAFLGALAARLDQGEDLTKAAAFGQAAAALHVSRRDRGAITVQDVQAVLIP